jgi:hypothetical protein
MLPFVAHMQDYKSMQQGREVRSIGLSDLGPGGTDRSTVFFYPFLCRKLAKNGMWTRILGR